MFTTVRLTLSTAFENNPSSPIIGNGIQKAFYDDPNVLYISVHVYQDGRFYPGGPEGDWNHCGSGAGVGK